MKNTTTIINIVLVFLLAYGVHFSAWTQKDNSSEKRFVEDAFIGTQLINSQTTKVLQPRSWQFEIQHRFGITGIDSSIITDFLGMDLPATMRFAFGWSINDRSYFKVGRTNYLKTYDVEYKYLVLKQTEGFKVPLSIAVFGGASVRTEKFPNVQANTFFEDDVTPFRYKNVHRLSYNTQIILSSKLSEKLTIQMTPIFIYRNLVPAYHDNFNLVLSGGLKYQFGLNAALTFEYAHVFNNRGDGFYDPFSLGVEFGTVNHVFQIFISNASRILESQVYTASGTNILDGKFLLGFNLQRNIWRK